ncbi:hypothetical protein GCM10028787_01020 [Brachybacterium horti]
MTDPVPHVVRRGQGAPLLLVHGNEVDHRFLLDLEDLFDESSPWERLHLDLAGFGRTPALPAPGGLPQLADWLDRVAGELLGGRPFAVIGSSLGGLLARDLVARRPERCLGIALLAPVVDPVHARRTLPPAEVLERDDELLGSLDPEDAALYAELAVVPSRGNWERFRGTALPGLRAADRGAVARLAADYSLPRLPDAAVEELDVPVLLAMGRQDAVVGYEDQLALARRLPHATTAVLDRAGHNLHLDQPSAVRDLLRHWLAAVGEPPRPAASVGMSSSGALTSAPATLRRLRRADAPDVLAAFASHPDMARQGTVRSPEEAERYVARLLDAGADGRPSVHEAWVIAEEGRVVGLVGVTVDEAERSGWFWYWLHAEARGRGLMARAAATVAQWALTDRGLERLELGHRVDNPASGAVARAAGFVPEGTERGKFLIDGARVDVRTYGRLRTDPLPAVEPLPLDPGPSGDS